MRRLGAIVIGAILLAGCGTQGGSPTSPKRPERTAPPASPIASPAPTTGGQADAQRLLQALPKAHASLQTASCEAVMYCRGGVGAKPKGLPDLGGEWEVHTTYQQLFKKGEQYRIDVTKCTNANSLGMKMLVKGTAVQVKLSGLLSVVPIHKNLGDKELLNFRGHRLDTGSLGGLAKRLGQGHPDARLVGEMTLDGATLDVVEIPRAPSFDKTIAKEVLGFDRQTGLVRYHAMHTDKRKVYELKLNKLRLNQPIPESRMAL